MESVTFGISTPWDHMWSTLTAFRSIADSSGNIFQLADSGPGDAVLWELAAALSD